jgi:hypothetical protein
VVLGGMAGDTSHILVVASIMASDHFDTVDDDWVVVVDLLHGVIYMQNGVQLMSNLSAEDI